MTRLPSDAEGFKLLHAVARRLMRRASAVGLLAVVALAAARPDPAGAQGRFRGVVVDSISRAPLTAVGISIQGTGYFAATDTAGRFSLALPLGNYIVRVRRIGYAPLVLPLKIRAADTLDVVILMQQAAQPLEPRVTEAPRNRNWPPGLDERRHEGFGTFITDSLLHRFDNSSLSEVLVSRATWVQVNQEQGRKTAVYRRGAGGAYTCYLSVWLDGVLLWEIGYAGNPPDLDQFHVDGLEAVELYSSADVPARFHSTNSACGTLLLWTRRGQRLPPGSK